MRKRKESGDVSPGGRMAPNAADWENPKGEKNKE